ncbi:hypothetical protein QTG54_015183 [Skeletonema marinoi]|uniref:Ankyrin repeat protein n=1 Tax=Skeletonema marinoi TaxID=267567 RepID=A0AAD8XVD3_9STRA|nr:hypothetical protein QTG54_015183 [Skeletonema marinoi]
MSDNNSRQSAEQLLSKELAELCESELLSNEGLREIIERYGLNDTRHVSDYAFFIAACWNEKFNEGIIRFLLDYFPAAASATDVDGWSPLHYVCRNKNVTLNIVNSSSMQLPTKVVKQTSKDGYLSIVYALMTV